MVYLDLLMTCVVSMTQTRLRNHSKISYPPSPELKREHRGQHATFLDLDVTIENNIFIYSDIPSYISYGSLMFPMGHLCFLCHLCFLWVTYVSYGSLMFPMGHLCFYGSLMFPMGHLCFLWVTYVSYGSFMFPMCHLCFLCVTYVSYGSLMFLWVTYVSYVSLMFSMGHLCFLWVTYVSYVSLMFPMCHLCFLWVTYVSYGSLDGEGDVKAKGYRGDKGLRKIQTRNLNKTRLRRAENNAKVQLNNIDWSAFIMVKYRNLCFTVFIVKLC